MPVRWSTTRAAPLLDCERLVGWDAAGLGLHLCIVAIEVEVEDGAQATRHHSSQSADGVVDDEE